MNDQRLKGEGEQCKRALALSRSMSERDALLAGRDGVAGPYKRKPYGSGRLSNPPIPLDIVEGLAADGTYRFTFTGAYESDTDFMFMWSILSISGFMTILGIIYAIRSNSLAIVVEATSEFIDTISFGLNLWCMYVCRGKDIEYQETIESRTALMSTGLLLLGGLRIGVQSYYQISCAADVDYNMEDAADMPCGLMQGRPHPKMVIMVACIMLAGYVPPFLVLYFRGVDLSRFKPEENINKASALLHCAFDVLLQILLIIASCYMLGYPAHSVEIDAGISIVLLAIMLALSASMWIAYHKTDSHIEGRRQSDVVDGRLQSAEDASTVASAAH